MKIRLVGAELFHADRRTDMTKLIVTFLNFVKIVKVKLALQRALKTQKSSRDVALLLLQPRR
jgi:hypothetical protein